MSTSSIKTDQLSKRGKPRSAGKHSTRTLPKPPRPIRYTWSKADFISTAIIAVLALFTRFIGLTSPVSSGTPVFDEKHYVPQAWDMVKSWDNLLIGGIESNPGYGLVVHPPLAKQIIALSEHMFGYTPMGWRFFTALFGVGVVLLIMDIARQLSNSWQVATFAGFIAVCDGVLLVSSKFGLLDIFQVFFIVGAAWALVRDHNQVRLRMHNAFLGRNKGSSLGSSVFGPRIGFRWWRFTAGVMLGLALSVKWNGLYYIFFFGLMSVFGDLALRRRYGVKNYVTGTLLRDTPAALASLVAVPITLYTWSWRAWFASETAVYRHAKSDGTIEDSSWLQLLPEAVAGWFHYHWSVLQFHSELTTSAGHVHPWDSKPWAWLVSARPILYFSSTGLECGDAAGATCRRMLFIFGTPIIWWLIVPALLWAMWCIFIRKDRRFTVPIVGFAAGFLPWIANMDRQMYFFYAVAFIPFIIVIYGLILGQIVGRGDTVFQRFKSKDHPLNISWGSFAAAIYLAAVLAMFIYFSPILYGYKISDSWYESLMWLPSWK